jgi:hypothetical protein
MNDESERDRATDGGNVGEETRPQQAGEAGTTRFGMEDGDNTDVSATGGPASDSDLEENA